MSGKTRAEEERKSTASYDKFMDEYREHYDAIFSAVGKNKKALELSKAPSDKIATFIERDFRWMGHTIKISDKKVTIT